MSDVATPWCGRFLEVRVAGNWEYAVRPRGMSAAIIIAIDDAADGRHVLLVEEYRVPLGALCLGLPAGLVGDEAEGEAPHAAAARELEEETGYRASHWQALGTFASSPGLTDETLSIYVATGLTKIGTGGGVEGENITVHRVRLEQIADFIATARARGVAIDVKLLALPGLVPLL